MKLFPISLTGRAPAMPAKPEKGGGRIKVGDANPYGIVRRVLVAAITGALPDDHRAEAADLLVQAMQVGEDEVRALAIIGLTEVGAPAETALPALIRCLLDPNETVRRRAARALGDFGGNAIGAVPQLTVALRDPSQQVRIEAVGALGRVGHDARPCLPTLIRLLGEEDTRTRMIVGTTLRRMGPYAVPYLMRALAEPDAVVRERAAVLLGQIGIYHDAVVQALLEACSDAEPEIRMAAREAISRLE